MLECRYYGNCYFMECDVPDICDGKGRCVSYRNGHHVETVCSYYEPMPDVEALEALAREMEGAAGSFGSYEGFSFGRSSPDLAYLAGSVAETYRRVAGIIRRSLGDGNENE